MGGKESKQNVQNAIPKLSESDALDAEFWNTFLDAKLKPEEHIGTLLVGQQIETMMNEKPENFKAMLSFCISELNKDAYTGPAVQNRVTNAANLLIRVLPYCLGAEWEEFWWSGAEPLGKTLLLNLMKCLFSPGLTINVPSTKKSAREVEVFLWRHGLSHNQGIHDPNKASLERRATLLQLLITCLSSNIYFTALEQPQYVNMWKLVFTAPDFPHTHDLFYSLINYILGYDPKGILNLPYTSYIGYEIVDQLTQMCIQALIVVTDFTPPVEEHLTTYQQERGYEVIAQRQTVEMTNEYLNLIASLQTTNDITQVYDALCRILTNFADSNTSFLPGSVKMVPCYHEAIVLLWKFLEFNPAAVPCILAKGSIADIVCPILFTLNECIGEMTNFAMVNVCTFLFLKLSSNREFAIALNRPNKSNEYLGLIKGTLADLMIQVYIKVIRLGHSVEGLVPYLLITLSNISAFVRSVNLQSGKSLVSLFVLYSRPEWLTANPTNHHLLFYILEVLNNLVQYQWEGAQPLALAILQQSAALDALVEFVEAHKPAPPQPPDETPTEEGEQLPSSEIMTPEALYGEDDEQPAEHQERTSVLNTHVSEVSEEAPEDMESDTVHNVDDVSPTEPDPSGVSPFTQAWAPDDTWITSWTEKLLLTPLVILTRHLKQILEPITDEAEQLARLRETTIVGVLPIPHPIITRKNEGGSAAYYGWMSSYTWGLLVLKTYNGGMYNLSGVKLFSINAAAGQRTPRAPGN